MEVELDALDDDLKMETKHDPNEHTGIHIRLESGALITLYRTGSYHIVGVDSEQALFDARDGFLEALQELELELPSGEKLFSVRNFVATTSIGKPVNLNALAIGLGLDQVGCEPE